MRGYGWIIPILCIVVLFFAALVLVNTPPVPGVDY